MLCSALELRTRVHARETESTWYAIEQGERRRVQLVTGGAVSLALRSVITSRKRVSR